MGKITEALKKAAEERIERIEKISRIKERETLIIKKKGNSRVDACVIPYFDSRASISEQYKILRTNLFSLNKGRVPKVLVLTSSIHSEGKTVTALNLGMVIAQSTQKPKVLLIDADLRRGKIAKYLGVDQKTGLSEVLRDKAEISDVLFNLDIDNLTFMANGSIPENPVELLASENMKQLLSAMRLQFDHIIIDSPPIISVTDAGILGSLADGAIMVIQSGRTQRGIVKHAIELLHQSCVQVLGHVLTNIEYHLPEYIYRYL